MSGMILIADAVATNRITLKVRLAAACYQTAAAATIDEAVRLARRLQPECVVADDSLAAGGAAGLCRKLAADENTRAIPVIVLCDPAARLEAVRAGATAVLDRPGEAFMLLARIRSLLASTGPMPTDDARTHDIYGVLPGMAEAPAAWTPAPDSSTSQLDVPGGRVVLVAPDAPTAIGWRHALSDNSFTVETSTADKALNAAATGNPADVYLIAGDLSQLGEGLRLMSELRARPASRHSTFFIALAPERSALAPMALDLGAVDVLPMALRERSVAEEARLRIAAHIGRRTEAERRRIEAEAERRWALTDPLTGLHNRRYAMPRLRAMAEADPRGRLAVMILDLDRFKAINDCHGHAAGDAVLRAVALRLSAALPAKALLSRIGGEEFLIAVPDIGPTEAEATAEMLRQAVAYAPVMLPPALGGGAISVTASVGTAQEGPGSDPEAVMLRADRALLDAKSCGRNRVIVARRDVAA